MKIKLSLRNNNDRVELVRINGSSRVVLGKTYPIQEDRRAASAATWGARPSPRQQREATIDEALPTRTQTILSHRLPQEVQQRVDAHTARHDSGRLECEPGLVAVVPLQNAQNEE